MDRQAKAVCTHRGDGLVHRVHELEDGLLPQVVVLALGWLVGWFGVRVEYVWVK